MSKFVIGHGINNIAAYSNQEAAKVAAAATPPVSINGTSVDCTVLEIPEGDYFESDDNIHHKKWNIVAPLIQ